MRLKFSGIFKWLYPGIGVKRWVGLGAFGAFLLVLGAWRLGTQEIWFIKFLDFITVVCGGLILILGVKRMLRSFIAVVSPVAQGGELVDLLYQKKQLSRGARIVTIGGGTGLSMLLSGLKAYTSNISAIVTVADDGGSSGRLRREFDMLPPGDIRNCLVALADAPALMQDLFQFRFDTNSQLSGHSFGNLFITVMTQLTGDFEKAIKETSKVLALRGQVIPSSLEKVVLTAEHQDSSLTVGEEKIPKAHKPIKRVFLEPQSPAATADAIRAIREAQVIVLGPGSLYTSIIPNLLVKEIANAVAASGAIKVYVCNVMTQPGETDGFGASDHIRVLTAHSSNRVLDYCIVNTGEVSPDILKRYSGQGQYMVVNDRRKIENMGYRVIEEDLGVIDNKVVRHNSEKLAKIIIDLIDEI